METTNNRRNIIVGIFVVVGLTIFILGIFTLGGQKKAFIKSFTVNVVFNDIQGLKTGNNVFFSGVKIGTIKKIRFFGSSQVLVTLNIEEQAHQYIHKDSKAGISSDGLIGNKIIVLTGGSVKAPFVEDGDRLNVSAILSTDDVMKTLQVNNKNLVDVTSNFKILSRNLVEGKGTVGSLLTDEQVANNFKKIVLNLEKTSESVSKMSNQLNIFSNKLTTSKGLINQLMTDTVVFYKLQSAVTELDKTSKSAAMITENLKQVSTKFSKNDNAIGLLLNDPKSAENIKNTLQNLETSTQKLDENMKALQSNFLFRGYFKNKKKEQEKESK